MIFRPCIDIHNGRVKQIVGSSLLDTDNNADENFVSLKNADYYADLYKKDSLKGGHVIILNSKDSSLYKDSYNQAVLALKTYPQGLQIGGGITDLNAEDFLNKGASHVIVTSFVFKNGELDYKNLNRIVSASGKDRLVLDLSCRKRNGLYYIVTDRWQKYTEIQLNINTLNELSSYCDEFLIHAVDVEGMQSGIDSDVLSILSQYKGNACTYAGGITDEKDIEKIKTYGKDKIDFTIGSALDIFGGSLSYKDIACKYR